MQSVASVRQLTGLIGKKEVMSEASHNPFGLTCSQMSLADLYDEVTMPADLRKAHQDNDRAVMQAYGFDVKTMTESQCVAELFKLYKEMTTV